MNFNIEILRGVFWNAIQIFINRAFGFVIKLFLARILFPEDYGLVGMATVFTTFINVFNDLGMGAALVQKKKEDLTEKHYHTAFWTGVAWSTLLYLIFSLGIGPLAAWFYEEPLLKKLIPVLSLGILASPINLVHRAQLTKTMNFKKMAIINNSGSIFSGILALGLALSGAGVWSLVFNSVSSIIIMIPLYFRATKWKPKWQWNSGCFRDIFGFGVYTTFTGVLNKIINQIDFLLIGKLIGAGALGYYSFAFIITDTLRSQLSGIISSVMFPVYSEVQTDKNKLKSYFLKTVKFNALLIYPPMFVLIIFGGYLIPLVFGSKWDQSIQIVQILAVSVIFHMLINSHTSLLRASGYPRLELKLQLFKAIFLFIPLVTFGTIYYGVVGTALGYTTAKILGVIVSLIVLNRTFQISFTDVFSVTKYPFLINIIPGIIGYIALQKLDWYICLLLFTTVLLGTTFLWGKKDLLKLIKARKEI